MPRKVSRREMLRRAAAVGAVTAVPTYALAQQAAAPRNLSAPAARTLDAIVARLIPTDDNGPGALEAGAARYIDLALGGALAMHLRTYQTNLAAVDAHAQRKFARAFAELPTSEQDTVLQDVEQNAAPGFVPSAAAFFDLVLGHTLEGTFSDPHYGGNRDFIGWELVGYPGLKLAVTADEQRFDSRIDAMHVSAYDLPMFAGTGGESHDD